MIARLGNVVANNVSAIYAICALLVVLTCSCSSMQTGRGVKVIGPRLPKSSFSEDSAFDAGYALIIGINDYEHEAINDLDYAVKDAKGMYDKLTDSEYGIFDTEKVFLLTSDQSDRRKQPTEINIWQSLYEIRDNATKRDTVIIVYAGHGTKENLIPMDGRMSITKSLINIDEFLGEIEGEKMKAGRVMVFLDSCRSEGIEKGGRSNSMANYEAFQKARGVATFASCGNKGKSYEFDEIEHGVFIKTILDALELRDDGSVSGDENGDGWITFGELWRWVPDTARDLAKDLGDVEQIPILLRTAKTNSPEFEYAISRCPVPKGKRKISLVVKADGAKVGEYSAKIDGKRVTDPVREYGLMPGWHQVRVGDVRGYKARTETFEIEILPELSEETLEIPVLLERRSPTIAALHSALWPGLGDFPDRKFWGWVMTATQIASLGAAAYLWQDYDEKLNTYEDIREEYGRREGLPDYEAYAAHGDLMNSKYDEVLTARTRANLFFWGAAIFGIRAVGAFESYKYMPKTGKGKSMLVSRRENGEIMVTMRQAF
ncbi:caspase domain-containing protein [Candidatus Poribacteria bacterium]